MSKFLTVVIIEKDPAEAKRTHELLKKNTVKKVKSIITPTLSEALAHLNKKKFDVLILDPELTDSQGIESFRTINQAAPNIPIILVIPSKDDAVARVAMSEGAQDFFLKGTFNGDMLVRSMGYAIERKHHERMQHEYALIIENSNEAIFSLSESGLIKSWNPAAENIYTYRAHEIVGKPFLTLVPAENQSEVSRLLKTIQLGSSTTQYETVLLDKNKKEVDSIISLSPIQNKLGTVIGAVILAQDFTRKKTSALQSSIQLRVASILAESNEVHHAAQSLLKVICESLEFSAGEIWVVDPNIKALRPISSWSPGHTSSQLAQVNQGLIFHLNEGLPGYLWSQKKPLLINKLDKEAVSTRGTLLRSMGIHSCFGFPIVCEKEVLGVCLCYGAHIKAFDVPFLIIFEIIGEQIGAFFKHRRMEEELLNLAQHDKLTGLVNKLYTENALIAMINQAKKNQTMVAILYFDLDQFKRINDSLGHHKGDLLLQEIARRVQKSIRDGDLIARFGGDEFAVILSGITNKEQIDVVAKKILNMVEQPFIFDKKDYYITASMGISLYPNDGDNIEILFKAADLSMYRVKKSGRNNYQYTNLELNNTEQEKLLLSTNLYRAVNKHEFVLYYQPIFDTQSGEIVSVEALIRWKTSKGEIIPPDEFIPQLEETNLILKAGLWVLQTACKQMKKWQTRCFNSVSVNISVRQLNDQLVPMIKTILNETGLSPDKLILEVTESMLMQQTYIVLDVLSSLAELGVQLAIDDFGTGYSSFSYLKSFKIKYLKIDKSFIEGLGESQSAQSIVTAIILMAHALDMQTIAEGVETKEQFDFLKENKCDMVQGYYFSKSFPPDELESKYHPAKE